MLFIHKRSTAPIDHWPAVRHGGVNNLSPDIQGKFLLLWNVDIVQREGAWHYVFEFDVRNSLEIGELARLVSNERSYPQDIDWKSWLGPDFHVISAAVRDEILNMPPEDAHTSALITGIREVPNAGPIPGRDPNDYFDIEIPRDLLLGLPSDFFDDEEQLPAARARHLS